MCGVAGVFHLGGGAVDAAELARMTGAIAHRGPDQEGFHLEPGLGLGFRRLAIIDLSGGGQPMFNEDGSVAIVFNGEIYNHLDLRRELQAKGHVFANLCDTEAIIHAWEEWGPACLDRLSGMFAFAIWDRNRRTLFLARDRLGKKPLYHATTPDGRFVFASELAALAEVSALPRRIDPRAVDAYFALGYIPDPGSIYHGIAKLPAAHCLTVSAAAGVGAPRRYWGLGPGETPADEGEAAEE
ncbi:MAG: asparagine synthetase B family protein, partial [Acetobacteraceae bacterium]